MEEVLCPLLYFFHKKCIVHSGTKSQLLLMVLSQKKRQVLTCQNPFFFQEQLFLVTFLKSFDKLFLKYARKELRRVSMQKMSSISVESCVQLLTDGCNQSQHHHQVPSEALGHMPTPVYSIWLLPIQSFATPQKVNPCLPPTNGWMKIGTAWTSRQSAILQ